MQYIKIACVIWLAFFCLWAFLTAVSKNGKAAAAVVGTIIFIIILGAVLLVVVKLISGPYF